MAFQPFTVEKVEAHGPEELLSRLRDVAMLKDPLVKPYAKARISLAVLDYSAFRPAQRYVLGDNLRTVQHLEWELARFGHHPLAIDGYLTMWTDQSEEPLDLLPPVVESVGEATGEFVNVINDGMHRLYAGRLEWRRPLVVLVEDLPPELPYYAYPIPGGAPWDQVAVLEGSSIPEGLIKKWHRIADNKRLYRNFNGAFRNVGAPRGQG